MQIGGAVDEFLLELIRKANYSLSGHSLDWVDGVFGLTIRPDVRLRIENSEVWRHFQSELLASAETSELQSANDIEARLKRFQEKHRVTHADIMRSAHVFRPDYQKWRQGKLMAKSVMSQRIEGVLSGRLPIKRKPRKQPGE